MLQTPELTNYSQNKCSLLPNSCGGLYFLSMFPIYHLCGKQLRIIKGWKKISNQGGYVNDTTGQTLTISKKEFTQKFHVLLFAGQETEKDEGKTISPDYSSESKAEAFAVGWMEKHPDGTA